MTAQAVLPADATRTARWRAQPWDVPWGAVLGFGAALALADWFWVVALGGAVGSIQRVEAPFARWLGGSLVLLPLFGLAVLVALSVARRRYGAVVRRARTVMATGLMVVAGASVVGMGTLVASAAFDYRLQVAQLDEMSTMGTRRCVDQCLEAQQQATLTLHLRAALLGCLLLVVTNLLLVAWLVAVRGGRLSLERAAPAAAERSWRAELQRVLVAALVGASAVQVAFAAEHLTGLVTTTLLLVLVVAGAELVCAGLPPGRTAWVATAMLAGGLVALVVGAHVAGRPLGVPGSGPGGVGLAEVSAVLLAAAALATAVVLIRGPRWLGERPASAYARRLGLVAVVAVTALGLAGSGLAALDLGGLGGSGGSPGHSQPAH
ncbi:MAG TPA: hypothetical protein VFJ28_07975 [Marmoricola sp.]|nr:hypothetical protein [Marmoricola sp.]